MSTTAAPPRYRPLTFGVTRASVRRGADGVMYLSADQPLQGCAERMSDRLLHWAAQTPEAVFIAQRERTADGKTGDWRRVSYAQALQAARRLAQALLDRGLSAERPVMILSDNDIEYLTLALGAMWAGVPYVPVSPAYSLVSQDHGKLRHIAATVTPGLVFAASAAYGRAIEAVFAPDVEVVLGAGTLEGREVTPFDDLLATASQAVYDEVTSW